MWLRMSQNPVVTHRIPAKGQFRACGGIPTNGDGLDALGDPEKGTSVRNEGGC